MVQDTMIWWMFQKFHHDFHFLTAKCREVASGLVCTTPMEACVERSDDSKTICHGICWLLRRRDLTSEKLMIPHIYSVAIFWDFGRNLKSKGAYSIQSTKDSQDGFFRFPPLDAAKNAGSHSFLPLKKWSLPSPHPDSGNSDGFRWQIRRWSTKSDPRWFSKSRVVGCTSKNSARDGWMEMGAMWKNHL